MLLLDLGTLHLKSIIRMEEKVKKYYERKRKGLDSFLDPTVLEEVQSYIAMNPNKGIEISSSTKRRRRKKRKGQGSDENDTFLSDPQKGAEGENVTPKVALENVEEGVDIVGEEERAMFYDQFILDIYSLQSFMLTTSMDFGAVRPSFDGDDNDDGDDDGNDDNDDDDDGGGDGDGDEYDNDYLYYY